MLYFVELRKSHDKMKRKLKTVNYPRKRRNEGHTNDSYDFTRVYISLYQNKTISERVWNLPPRLFDRIDIVGDNRSSFDSTVIEFITHQHPVYLRLGFFEDKDENDSIFFDECEKKIRKLLKDLKGTDVEFIIREEEKSVRVFTI